MLQVAMDKKKRPIATFRNIGIISGVIIFLTVLSELGNNLLDLM